MPYAKIEDRRAAAKRHYERNAATVKARAATMREQCRQRNREHLAALKTDKACADCGVSYPPYVMQFDHIGEDKDRALAVMAQAPVSLARLDAEIAKCELVCANCHAARTWQRRQVVAGVGFEPTASGLWARRASGCATPLWCLGRGSAPACRWLVGAVDTRVVLRSRVG